MNVSSILGLEALKIKTRRMLTLIEASCKVQIDQKSKKKVQVTRTKYTGLSVRTRQSLPPAKSTAKSNLPLGKRQEYILSHNGHFNGYFPLPDYIRDSKERRRIGRPCTLQSC